MEAGGGGTNQNSSREGGKSSGGRSKGGGQQRRSEGCAAKDAAYASRDVSSTWKRGNVETWRGGGGEGGGIEGEERKKLGRGELGAVIGAFDGFDGVENLQIQRKEKRRTSSVTGCFSR